MRRLTAKCTCLVLCTVTFLGLTACGDGSNEHGHKHSNNKETTRESEVSESTAESTVAADIPEDTTAFISTSEPIMSRDELPYEGTEYSFKDISLIIPDNWEDRYFITEYSDGFSIHQTMSYDIDESGFLCSINRYEGNPGYINNGRIIAYTPEYTYTIEYPSDVSWCADNKKCNDDYVALCNDLDMVLYSLLIDAEEVNYNCSEYVYPTSECMLLDEGAIMSVNYESMLLGKYEIYARHGMIFYDSDIDNCWYLSKYFEGMSWYSENPDYSEADLNDYERQNIAAIDECLETLQADIVTPECYDIGTTINIDLNGDGQTEEISYYNDEEEAAIEAEYWEAQGYDTSYETYPVIQINDDIYKLWDYEEYGYIFDYAHHEFYITDISPNYPGLEIAIEDDGPSDDSTTHFFTLDDNGVLVHIGDVEGYPCETYLYTFSPYGGSISSTYSTWMVGNGVLRAPYWYDYDNSNIVNMISGMTPYYTSCSYKLNVDIPVYLSPDTDNAVTYTFKKGETLWPVATDNDTLVKVKNANGVYGYIKIVPECKIENVDMPVTEALDGVVYAG